MAVLKVINWVSTSEGVAYMWLSMCDKINLTDLDSLSSQSSNFVLFLLLVTASPPDAIDVSGVDSTPLGM